MENEKCMSEDIFKSIIEKHDRPAFFMRQGRDQYGSDPMWRGRYTMMSETDFVCLVSEIHRHHPEWTCPPFFPSVDWDKAQALKCPT